MTVIASGSDIAFERLAPVLEPLPEKFIASVRTGTGLDRKNYPPVVAGIHMLPEPKRWRLQPVRGSSWM
ncbi:hypothetical protein ACNKHM_19285 [Shigella sonnei]